MNQPPSFSQYRMCDWEAWVLDNGLPELPEALAEDEASPVAYWRCESWAAVLHAIYRPADPGYELEGLDTETQTFHWSGHRWLASDGSGGSRWSDGLQLRAPALRANEVVLLGHGWYGGQQWVCGTARGVAGHAVRTIEVEQHGRVIVRSITSPVGAWLAAFDGRRPAVVRVRDDRSVLLEDIIEPP